MLRVHELWNQYTQGLVRNAPAGAAASSATAAAAAAAKVADLHGARVTVVQHRNPQLVGASGVVLRRSTAALHVVTPGDRVKGASINVFARRPNSRALRLMGDVQGLWIGRRGAPAVAVASNLPAPPDHAASDPAHPAISLAVVPLKGCAAQYVINGIVLQLTG